MASPQGPNSGATFADDATVGTVAWTSPGNAATSDNVRATAAVFSQVTHYLKATNFSFTIPTGATINGVFVEAEVSTNAGAGQVEDSSVKLVKGGTIQGTEGAVAPHVWTGTDTYISWGGATDLWGLSLTPADVNASTFGAVISALEVGDGAMTARIDHIRITVYFTWAGPASGATFADDAAVGTIAWTSPGNAVASDDSRATAALTISTTSHYLKATNFGFAIPAAATITGIFVEVENSEAGGAGTVRDSSVRIVKGGVISGNNRAIAIDWSPVDSYVPYSSDLWGLSWTPADINATDFGVAISAFETGSGSETARIDHIRITVAYSLGGPPERRRTAMAMTGFGS